MLYLTIIFFFACAVRHYEIMYLIHEKYEEEVAAVNEKVQGNLSQLAYIFLPSTQIPAMTDRASSIVYHFSLAFMSHSKLFLKWVKQVVYVTC